MTSDGTGAGTVILKNIRSGSASSSPQSFVKLGSKIIFTARESTSYQPWVTDGTALGTVKLTAQVQPVVLSNLFKKFNGKVYFIATTTTAGLYETDGTPGGTVLVKDQITTGTGLFVGEVINNKLVFPCIVATGDELCVTDGTTSGTSALTDLISGASALSSSIGIFPSQNSNNLLLSIDDGISGREPWITDGTEVGTYKLKDIAVGESYSSPFYLTSHLNQIYFFAAGTNA